MTNAARLLFLVKRGVESNVRQLSTELGKSVRETRIELAGLKAAGAVVSVRRQSGSSVRVWYRRAGKPARVVTGESGA